MTSRQIVESYIPIVKFIAAVFGPRCEVILHCLDDMEHSIIAIENGHITGRSIGGNITDFALSMIFDKKYQDNAFIANYPGKTASDNKVIRSSTFYIRDTENKIIGLLCTNVDITEVLKLKEFCSMELSLGLTNDTSEMFNVFEQFNLSVDDMVESAMNRAMAEIGCNDVHRMLKEEKKRVIAILDEKKIFTLKQAVSIIAPKLAISEPTAYRYLREIRETEEVH